MDPIQVVDAENDDRADEIVPGARRTPRRHRTTLAFVAMVAALLLEGCAAPEEAPAEPSARFNDECYVTGSRIRIRTPDCRDEGAARGVKKVDPSVLSDLPRGNSMGKAR